MEKHWENHGLKNKTIVRIGVIGCGTMGVRIAYRCIVNEITCHLFDISGTVLALAEKQIRGFMEKDVEQGQLDSTGVNQAMERLRIYPKFEPINDQS